MADLQIVLAVNPDSPFSESAGSNPMDKFKTITPALHDYGTYLVSCESPKTSPAALTAPSMTLADAQTIFSR